MPHCVQHSESGDLPALRELWNRCLGERFPMTERLLRQNLDGALRTTATASLVVRDRGAIIGWALSRAHAAPPASLERLRGTGGLGALCVAPEHRGRGVASALLAAAERHLTDHGVTRVDTVVAPFHFLPGVPEECADLDAFLDRRGYRLTGTCFDMEGDASAFVDEGAAARHGALPELELRPIREGDEPGLRALLAREFAAVWGFIMEDHLARGGSRDDVLLAVERGEVLGFCHLHDERSIALAGSTAWFPLLGESYGGLGPIGVAAAQRGRGVGLALLCAAIEHQRRRGVRRMVIDWTTLESFYGRVGFRPFRRFRQRARPLR